MNASVLHPLAPNLNPITIVVKGVPKIQVPPLPPLMPLLKGGTRTSQRRERPQESSRHKCTLFSLKKFYLRIIFSERYYFLLY